MYKKYCYQLLNKNVLLKISKLFVQHKNIYNIIICKKLQKISLFKSYAVRISFLSFLIACGSSLKGQGGFLKSDNLVRRNSWVDF